MRQNRVNRPRGLRRVSCSTWPGARFLRHLLHARTPTGCQQSGQESRPSHAALRVRRAGVARVGGARVDCRVGACIEANRLDPSGGINRKRPVEGAVECAIGRRVSAVVGAGAGRRRARRREGDSSTERENRRARQAHPRGLPGWRGAERVAERRAAEGARGLAHTDVARAARASGKVRLAHGSAMLCKRLAGLEARQCAEGGQSPRAMVRHAMATRSRSSRRRCQRRRRDR